jgi:SAM-dependent methyltransferase
MEKKIQAPETYDQMFEEGGSDGIFDLHYKRSGYYPLFKAVAKALQRKRPQSVLEVGCGTGPMAHLLMDTTQVSYSGFDFSPLAVQKAQARTGRPEAFAIGDATAAQTYAGRRYDAIICTEVLEHIENDQQAMQHWASGTYCVCSVPNYDADTHVRFFRNEAEVRARYGALIKIDRIQKLNKPFLNDFTIGKWLQAVRWNRFRLDRLLWLVGISDFDRDGGWFVFSGTRL